MQSLVAAPIYQVFALRYGTQADRTAGENFLRCDVPDMPMPQDYFIWAIRGEDRVIVVDTGFSMAEAGMRGRAVLCDPADALERVGIAASSVRDVVLTHMHYDHAGNLDLVPTARFHVQDREMQYCTGRHMRHEALRRTFSLDDVLASVRLLYEGRLVYHDGEARLAPGITLHRVGGHTHGQQVVRISTQRGAIVLASDGVHFWANLRDRNPFPILVDVAATLDGYEVIESLVESADHVVPGHDPAVLRRFPHWRDDANIVSLHEDPLRTN